MEPLPPPSKLPSRAGGSTSVNGHGRKGKGKSREGEDEAMDGHQRANGHVDAEVVGPRPAHGQERARGRLVDDSLACRYLAAQCLVRRRGNSG
jgi:anaphase-promoting complex subunit 6